MKKPMALRSESFQAENRRGLRAGRSAWAGPPNLRPELPRRKRPKAREISLRGHQTDALFSRIRAPIRIDAFASPSRLARHPTGLSRPCLFCGLVRKAALSCGASTSGIWGSKQG